MIEPHLRWSPPVSRFLVSIARRRHPAIRSLTLYIRKLLIALEYVYYECLAMSIMIYTIK